MTRWLRTGLWSSSRTGFEHNRGCMMAIAKESTVKRGAAVYFIVLAIIAAALGLLVVRSFSPADGRPILLAPMADMPDFVHAAYPDAQTAYRFAHANHGLLTHFP